MTDPIKTLSPNIRFKDKRTEDFVRKCLNKPEEERRKKQQLASQIAADKRRQERAAKVEKVLKQFAEQDAKLQRKEAKQALEERIDAIAAENKRVLRK